MSEMSGVRWPSRFAAAVLILGTLVACAGKGPAPASGTQPAQTHTTSTAQIGKLSMADFSFLQLGMTYEEIQARVGDADEQIGSGMVVYGYYLNDGSELNLTFYPEDVLFSVSRYDPQTHRREMVIAPAQ